MKMVSKGAAPWIGEWLCGVCDTVFEVEEGDTLVHTMFGRDSAVSFETVYEPAVRRRWLRSTRPEMLTRIPCPVCKAEQPKHRPT